MKRLVWLLLAVFGAALAQVPPVDLPVTKQAACPCCREGRDCGMPDCVPPPATNPLVVNLQSPATVIRISAQRVAPVPFGPKDRYYARFESRPAPGPAFRAPAMRVCPVSVPLFAAHCSFLL